MTTGVNQSDLQQSIRAVTGTTLDYNGDWLALFTHDSIAAGAFDERMLNWINFKLTTSYTSLPTAQQAYAVSKGKTNWSSMNSI